MRRADVDRLLALASQFDGRSPDDATSEAWTRLFVGYLPDMTYDEAEAAVYGHYAASSEWLMPSMIVTAVRQARSKTYSIPVDEEPYEPTLGAKICGEILRRIRVAGGADPLSGRTVGPDRCEVIAEQVLAETEARTGYVRPGQHCGRTGCLCTHEQSCDAGWVASKSHPGAYKACANCAPTRAMILSKSHSTREAGAILRDPARTGR